MVLKFALQLGRVRNASHNLTQVLEKCRCDAFYMKCATSFAAASESCGVFSFFRWSRLGCESSCVGSPFRQNPRVCEILERAHDCDTQLDQLSSAIYICHDVLVASNIYRYVVEGFSLSFEEKSGSCLVYHQRLLTELHLLVRMDVLGHVFFLFLSSATHIITLHVHHRLRMAASERSFCFFNCSLIFC